MYKKMQVEGVMAKPTARTLVIVSMALLGCSSVPSINGCKIEPNTQCPQADLSGADLTMAILAGADFEGANLFNAHMPFATLSGANLHGANCRGANLSMARYNARTMWPEGFDPKAAGAVLAE